MDIKEQKNQLRQRIKEINETLTPEYCEEASRKICRKVIETEGFKKAETVFCFVGVGSEPDTREIIEMALKAGKHLCVPLCLDKTSMAAIEITDYDRDLVPGFFGLLEPKKNLPVVYVDNIDFAVIPCVSCDSEGNRLGHGRGYYDRYLEGRNFQCVLLCFEKSMSEVGEIPVDEHDRAIEMVITDAE
jgi:5-formyltetrahydrofolate cyclo-ligase